MMSLQSILQKNLNPPWRLLLVAVVFLLQACDETPEFFNPPSIIPPEPSALKSLVVNPGALPANARARLPGMDTDSFFVSIDAAQAANLTLADITNAVVSPVLSAVGFDQGIEGLRLSPNDGVDMPRGDLIP